MKIEIGESLAYSYLRHVKQCGVVQLNWKASDAWDQHLAGAALTEEFNRMRENFGAEMFGQNANPNQFLRQGEVDVLGIAGEKVFTFEIAFHENGLNYGGGNENRNRVMKKMLRTYLLLRAYFPGKKLHIYFASPKVHPAAVEQLEAAFAELNQHYSKIQWKFFHNEIFAEEIYRETLDSAMNVADTSELFMRAVKLRDIAEGYLPGPEQNFQEPENPDLPNGPQNAPPAPVNQQNNVERLQPLVRRIMRVLLQTHPLSQVEIQRLMDLHYCRHERQFAIWFPIVRPVAEGRQVNGHPRYWVTVYGGQYYVCSEWWRDHHVHNANRWRAYLEWLAQEYPDEGRSAQLQQLITDLQQYLQNNG